jgi:hypothetical protein
MSEQLFSKCLRLHIGPPIGRRSRLSLLPPLLAIGIGAVLMGAARLIF